MPPLADGKASLDPLRSVQFRGRLGVGGRGIDWFRIVLGAGGGVWHGGLTFHMYAALMLTLN